MRAVIDRVVALQRAGAVVPEKHGLILSGIKDALFRQLDVMSKDSISEDLLALKKQLSQDVREAIPTPKADPSSP